MTIDRRLGAEDVIRIASKLTVDDETFVIGGQAVNLWAWLYRERHPYLRQNGPFTSQDIDYFGSAAAADRFADAVGGVVRRPDGNDMNTPQTAIVQIDIGGRAITIDFLNAILGVAHADLAAGVSLLALAAEMDGRSVEIEVPVLHPVLCLQSRIGNMLSPATLRRDDFAWRQLHAAIAVIEVFLEDALDADDRREVKRSLRALFAYLRSHPFGRVADRELGVDALDIVRRLAGDEQLDPRFRDHQLGGMIREIEKRGAARDRD
ncbi:hypothetical protein C3941_08690 [Kaistia algarum]|uniref:hypothetical protein n=1 Tax=Kaistia algarum TaxID=2083279 RepID=UPI000CE746AE|nr:hypothetical protein [Kaistia algarum]MCX5512133.1 hypothetical protein [Kaistia algarum]PPE80242.1 hypothetical protein C3941_08690 [Kaistia algarum]